MISVHKLFVVVFCHGIGEIGMQVVLFLNIILVIHRYRVHSTRQVLASKNILVASGYTQLTWIALHCINQPEGNLLEFKEAPLTSMVCKL